MSHNNLWTVAFLKGNDKKSMLKKNVTKVFRDLKNWEGKVVDCKGKNHPVITLVPCDMSTQHSDGIRPYGLLPVQGDAPKFPGNV